MGKTRANAIERSARGQVVSVYDSAKIHDTNYMISPDEDTIINDPSIDAVFICTPNYRIVPLCKQALAAGKHVFSEKPPAFNAAEVEEVRRIEASSGKKLMYGFNHRHHDSIKKMKQIVDGGELGKVLWMRGRYGKEVDEDYFKGWRADPKLAGGVSCLTKVFTCLDLFLHFAGDFDEIHSIVSNLHWKMDGLEDNVFAIMRNTESGISASLHSTMTQWRYLFSLEVFLEKGSLILNGLKTSSGVYGDEELAIKYNESGDKSGNIRHEEIIKYETNNSWNSEIREFFDAISENKHISNGNSEQAYQLMETIDRIYQKK